jgi:hypothetical protein
VTQWSWKSAFTVFLLGIISLFLIQTLSLNSLARLVPLLVVVPTWALVLAQVKRDLRGEGTNLAVEKTLFSTSDEYRKSVVRRAGRREILNRMNRSGAGVAWVVMMFALVYLFGLLLGSPLYVFLYLKFRAGKGWVLASSMGVVVWILSYALAGTGLYRLV